MIVLSIGSDRKLFEDGSAVQVRAAAYGECFDAMHIIVFSTREHGFPTSKQIAANVWAYPTNSRSRWLYGFDACRIAWKMKLIGVVTVQDPFETGLVGWMIARLKRVPLHVQVHTDIFAVGFVRGRPLNYLRRILAKFVLRRAAGVRVVSERIQRSVKKYSPRRIPVYILPIFVETEQFVNLQRVKHPKFKIALLCVGRLEPEKRFGRAITALAMARKAGHDTGLTIVGEGSQRAVLEEFAERLGVLQWVEFVGWQQDLAPYYAAADVVLVPSDFEGYGMVIIEALSAGIPVIATDVGIAREAGAIVVNQKEFSKAVIQWMQNGPRQATLEHRPYRDFDDYVRQWCESVQKCV